MYNIKHICYHFLECTRISLKLIFICSSLAGHNVNITFLYMFPKIKIWIHYYTKISSVMRKSTLIDCTLVLERTYSLWSWVEKVRFNKWEPAATARQEAENKCEQSCKRSISGDLMVWPYPHGIPGSLLHHCQQVGPTLHQWSSRWSPPPGQLVVQEVLQCHK